MKAAILSSNPTCGVAIILSPAAFAGEEIPLDQLPAPVIQAVQEQFPKAELIKGQRETDDGKVKYEVKIRDGGQLYEVDVTPEGKILKVDRED